jgi:hypothetical protein
MRPLHNPLNAFSAAVDRFTPFKKIHRSFKVGNGSSFSNLSRYLISRPLPCDFTPPKDKSLLSFFRAPSSETGTSLASGGLNVIRPIALFPNTICRFKKTPLSLGFSRTSSVKCYQKVRFKHMYPLLELPYAQWPNHSFLTCPWPSGAITAAFSLRSSFLKISTIRPAVLPSQSSIFFGLRVCF